ncbi:amidohydrolase family protein [Companilactobacillus zhachilii]|uniref:Amidohydrolase family protein n=1 Tax=Companilactobacillus zhachilii TaxID=2304606 RepID=A0A386PU18_9LACO|nr:amidohydrolase family protein [Companilactobacillus zhachilii]AYE38588.1 amidohydrolase family protein [Companilactobacillus zhachilii]
MNKTFTNLNLFNGIDETIVRNSYFTVNESGRITEIGVGIPNDDSQKIDLKGKYVMPGMINAHTHIMMDPFLNKFNYASETEVTFEALNNLQKLLLSGVTYVRDCGCAFDVDIKLRKLQEDGQLKGTEILPSGRPMTMTGGHADFVEGLDGETTWGHITDSNDAMRHAVRQNFKRGANNIKVMVTGGVMSPTDQVDDVELTEEEIRIAVEEAHSKHMTVAAHAQGNRGIQFALNAGVDSIEHGIYLDKKQAEFMKDNDICLVPTLSACVNIEKFAKGKVPNYMYLKNQAVKADLFRNATMATQKGVKIIVGTDAGTPFNSFDTGTADEVVLLTELGLTPYQALLGTNIYAAELLKIDDQYGSIDVDKFADFLVLDENPLDDITAIRQANKLVYKKGELVNKKVNVGLNEVADLL